MRFGVTAQHHQPLRRLTRSPLQLRNLQSTDRDPNLFERVVEPNQSASVQ